MSFSSKGTRLLSAVETYMRDSYYDSLLLRKLNITKLKDGHLEGAFKITKDCCNCADGLHGGFSSSIMDIGCFYGVLNHPQCGLAYTNYTNLVYMNRASVGETACLSVKPIKIAKRRALMECLLYIEETKLPLVKGITEMILSDLPVVHNLPFDNTIKD